MIKVVVGFVFLPLTFFSASPALSQQDSLPIVRIGFIHDGPHEDNAEFFEMFSLEIRAVLEGEFDVRFPSDKWRNADHTLAGVVEAVSEMLADPDVDLLIAGGPLSSYDVTRRGPLPKPTIAPFVMDPEVMGLPLVDGTSGVPNLTYVAMATEVTRDFQAFREVVPFETLTVLGNPRWAEEIPAITLGAQEAARRLGIELQLIPVDTPIENALQAIPPDAEAVYITPLLHLTRAEWDRLVFELNRRRLPTFSMLGIEEVERGVLATMRPETFFPQVARRVALNVQRILLGEEPGSLPVFFDCGERMTINMETARTIGRFPNWNVLTEAELLNYEEETPDRVLSISGVAHEAQETNLDLLVQERVLSAGAEEVRLARSTLLAQLEANATGLVIDQDRANASFGAQAERTLSGGATLAQLLFSEPAWANLSVQEDLQWSRWHGREEVRLDVILEAVSAYLDVLRTRALLRVQRENVVATRSNLELSRVRRSVGTARAGEVLRWESQIAIDRNRVISAEALQMVAEVGMNRLLHRPQEERFGVEDLDVVIMPDGRVRTTDPSLLTSDQRLAGYGMNPLAWDAFRDFMVEEGLALSPELRQLDAAIAAQERVLQSSTRVFWAPTVALQGSLDNRFSRAGAGSTGLQLQGLPDGFPVFPTADDLSWSLALSFSIPIFNGGSRLAARTQAAETLQQLRVQKEALSEKIEQRIRAAAFAMGSSYMNIGLSAKAAQAAGENLGLVRDAYAQGAVSIIELLDAQYAALAADEAAAIAVYVFVGAEVRVQRAIGRYDFFMTQAEREAYFQRLDEHFERIGIVPS
jgi:outer membrane protein TolC/ABC-type uncharacterized transport system substrate-binding protein